MSALLISFRCGNVILMCCDFSLVSPVLVFPKLQCSLIEVVVYKMILDIDNFIMLYFYFYLCTPCIKSKCSNYAL